MPPVPSAPAATNNPILSLLFASLDKVVWLIPDFLPESYLVTLIGGEGVGKSTLSYAWAMALATGCPVMGRTPQRPRTVLYFDSENALPDATAYLQRTWHGLGRPSASLIERHLWLEHFTLSDAGWAQRAEERIKAVQPALIVFDTALSCCPPLTAKGEDDNADASRTISRIRALCRLTAPTASALILKHALTVPQGEDRYDLRGAKAWKGQADSVLFLVRARGRRPADGLTASNLFPLKARAYGLQQRLRLEPHRTDDGQGLRLDAVDEPAPDPPPMIPD